MSRRRAVVVDAEAQRLAAIGWMDAAMRLLNDADRMMDQAGLPALEGARGALVSALYHLEYERAAASQPGARRRRLR